jgi:hypothetical protein
VPEAPLDQSDEIKYENVGESDEVDPLESDIIDDGVSPDEMQTSENIDDRDLRAMESEYTPIIDADDVSPDEIQTSENVEDQSWTEKLAAAAVGVAAIVGVSAFVASDKKKEETPETEMSATKESETLLESTGNPDFLSPIIEEAHLPSSKGDRDTLVSSSNLGKEMRIDTSRSTPSKLASTAAAIGIASAVTYRSEDEETGPQILKRPGKYSSELEPAADLTAFVPPPPTNYVVKYSYHATRADELEMLPGDLVGIEKSFDDGWARVQNMSHGRKRGLIPFGILVPIKVYTSFTNVYSLDLVK